MTLLGTFAWALLAVASGCLDAVETPPCEVAACPSTPVPASFSHTKPGEGAPPAPSGGGQASPDRPPSPPAPNVVAPPPPPPQPIRWEECEGVVGTAEVPRPSVEATVPAAFRIQGLHESTASILFEALSCGRVGTSSAVMGPRGLFHFLARVAPTNETWATGGPSFYALWTAAAGANLTDALSALGLPAEAASFTESVLAEFNGTQARQWHYGGASFSAQLEFGQRGEPTGRSDHHAFYWAPLEDGWVRVDVDKTYRVDSLVLQPGALRTQGTWTWLPQNLLPTPLAWTGQKYVDALEIWSGNKSLYR